MKTKSITLFYKVTPTQVISPSAFDLEKKEQWIKQMQATIPSEWEAEIVKVTYEMFNPHIQDLQRFFNGTVVMYYCIQNEDMIIGEPTSELLAQYREEILDELLGYDYKTVNKVIRKRKSTTELKSVQAWNNLIKLAQETLFENAGYEFPDSEAFWELVNKVGYDEAKRESRIRLQNNLAKRNESK